MSQGDAFKMRIYERVTTPGRLRRAHRMYDQWTFDVIKRVVDPDSNCVDVGCHEGLVLERLIAAAHSTRGPIPRTSRADPAVARRTTSSRCGLRGPASGWGPCW